MPFQIVDRRRGADQLMLVSALSVALVGIEERLEVHAALAPQVAREAEALLVGHLLILIAVDEIADIHVLAAVTRYLSKPVPIFYLRPSTLLLNNLRRQGYPAGYLPYPVVFISLSFLYVPAFLGFQVTFSRSALGRRVKAQH